MKDRDPFVDRLLDASLERFGNHEPLAGLEDRVLARLRLESKPAPWFGHGWKFAATLAAVVVAAVVVYIYRCVSQVPLLTPSKSVITMTARAVAPHAGAGSSQTAKSTVGLRKKHQHVQRAIRPREPQLAAAEPHLAVFPTPAPLSEEEKLLLTYVRNAPPTEPQLFDQQIEPLAKLKSLEITPLDLPQLRQGIEYPSTRRN